MCISSRIIILSLIVLAPLYECSAGNYVVVSKKELTLVVYNRQGERVFKIPIACGKNLGNKEKEFDCKTPEGTFTISQIVDSKEWRHDFGYGLVEGAYGPYFIRLHTPPFKGIGIHGTCYSESIGTRSSEGCIRVRNEDIVGLLRFVSIGMEVTILSENN